MKRKIILGIGLFLLAGFLYMYGEAAEHEQMQADIADEIIRLHVIANSDTKEDQALKLKVRDAIVTQLREKLKDEKSVTAARKEIRSQLTSIRQIANRVICENGYSYEARAGLEKAYFPIKQYGDMTFPAGEYEALRVKIGGASGKNWWCVMYPTLCFVDSTYQIVPEESKARLKENLTDEEYDSLLQGNDEVTYGFKLQEIFQELF